MLLIDSDEENEACFCQAMHLMSKKYKKDAISSWVILIDAGSSASAFCNRCLLEIIGETSKTLHLVANGGELRANKMGM